MIAAGSVIVPEGRDTVSLALQDENIVLDFGSHDSEFVLSVNDWTEMFAEIGFRLVRGD